MALFRLGTYVTASSCLYEAADFTLSTWGQRRRGWSAARPLIPGQALSWVRLFPLPRELRWGREAASSSSRYPGVGGTGVPQERPGTLSRKRAPRPTGSILPLSPACQVSEGFRCSLPLPTCASSFPTLTPGLSTPVHPTGMSLASETSGCLLGKAGCEPHLRDITGHPSHWEFECCHPQENSSAESPEQCSKEQRGVRASWSERRQASWRRGWAPVPWAGNFSSDPGSITRKVCGLSFFICEVCLIPPSLHYRNQDIIVIMMSSICLRCFMCQGLYWEFICIISLIQGRKCSCQFYR